MSRAHDGRSVRPAARAGARVVSSSPLVGVPSSSLRSVLLPSLPPHSAISLFPSRCLSSHTRHPPSPWRLSLESADGNPSIPLRVLRGLLRYKLYAGTVEIMKRRALGPAFGGTCGICGGALCRPLLSRLRKLRNSDDGDETTATIGYRVFRSSHVPDLVRATLLCK